MRASLKRKMMMSRYSREVYDCECEAVGVLMDDWLLRHPGHNEDEAFDAIWPHIAKKADEIMKERRLK